MVSILTSIVHHSAKMTPLEKMLKKLQEATSAESSSALMAKKETSTIDTKSQAQKNYGNDEELSRQPGAHFIPGQGWQYVPRATPPKKSGAHFGPGQGWGYADV